MGQAAFLRALFDDGRVQVGRPTARVDAADAAAVDELVHAWDAANRADFPGNAPPLALDVARWAVEQFHRACQFAVYRDADAALIAAGLATPCTPCTPADAAAQHYAVDLVFRFLPDLLRLAKSASPGDPLCEHLRAWAAAWPLSSVGIAGVNPADASAVWEHAGLLRVYVDRIVARRDASRLADPRVAAAVRTALGLHDDLAPQLAAALTSENHENAKG